MSNQIFDRDDRDPSREPDPEPRWLTELRRRDWAVRVLDVWAEPRDGYARSWENCRKSGSDWVALTDGGVSMVPGKCPADARLAAARAEFPRLPADVRAELGECP